MVRYVCVPVRVCVCVFVQDVSQALSQGHSTMRDHAARVCVCVCVCVYAGCTHTGSFHHGSTGQGTCGYGTQLSRCKRVRGRQ